jgi:protein-tyrosine phosphatase
MDITWLSADPRYPGTERIAVGGGIWTPYNMALVAEEGITHIIDMQIESDDRDLVPPRDPEGPDIQVCFNPTDDDFEPKPAALFRVGVEFAAEALKDPAARLFIHCAAGVHRAPMMTLAVLGAMGWDLEEAMQLIETKRPVADFADVYVQSVADFLAGA